MERRTLLHALTHHGPRWGAAAGGLRAEQARTLNEAPGPTLTHPTSLRHQLAIFGSSSIGPPSFSHRKASVSVARSSDLLRALPKPWPARVSTLRRTSEPGDWLCSVATNL